MKIPNRGLPSRVLDVSLARIVSEDSQRCVDGGKVEGKSSKDS